MPENTLIEALVRGEQLVVADCEVVKPEGPHHAMQAVLARAEKITEVSDENTQRKASIVAQELQGLRKGLEANFRNAKQPVVSFGRTLDNVYKELDRPMEVEYRRIDKLVSAYQDDLARKAELARAKVEAERRERERVERERLVALERAKEAAELKARLAEESKERQEALRTAEALAPVIAEQKVAMEINNERMDITLDDELPAKPPGGRVWTQYKVVMIDAVAVALEHPELVTITLKEGPAQDFAKSLDEAGKPMKAKGLLMSKTTRTSFVGAAAIRISSE